MKILTIPQKACNTGTIRDIASVTCDRTIQFRGGAKYAVVLAPFYAGRGYTTHKTPEAAAAKSLELTGYPHQIIDADGGTYDVRLDYNGVTLEPVGWISR